MHFDLASAEENSGDREHRVLIAGLGDQGKRIATGLAVSSSTCKLYLVARNESEATAFIQGLSRRTRTPPKMRCLDLSKTDALAETLLAVNPHVVVHAASLLSPWYLPGRTDALASRISGAGFALQLPAQLPLLLGTMQAVRSTGLRPLVVNCSYPDATHPILERLHLSPTIGIGNAGIILGLIERRLARAGPGEYRLIAHHAHVHPFITGARDSARMREVKLFRCESPVPFAQWSRYLRPRAYSRRVNAISAWHAVSIIRAFTGEGRMLTTSAPGVFGLPGGWPVQISPGQIRLHLPRALIQAEVVDWNQQSARHDGIERIDSGGCVHFTEKARDAVSLIHPKLGEPLRPQEALERFNLLKEVFAQTE